MKPIKISINLPTSRKENQRPLLFSFNLNETWYLSCGSGSFISSLFDWLRGRKVIPQAKLSIQYDDVLTEGVLAQKEHIQVLQLSNNSGKTGSYYQQRYQATDNEDIINLQDFLGVENDAYFSEKLAYLHMNHLLEESLNMLSTGEYRKACLLKVILNPPKILFLVDPFPGLDPNSRKEVSHLLEELKNIGCYLVFVGSNFDMPKMTTHVLVVENEEIVFRGVKNGLSRFVDRQNPFHLADQKVFYSLPPNNKKHFKNAVVMKNVEVKYNGRMILEGVNWQIRRKGEMATQGRKWFWEVGFTESYLCR